jgi:spore coat polysaccharide biosynthesis protein SpsF
VFHMPKEAGYSGWLGETMGMLNAKILVVDVRDDLSCQQLTEVRREDRLIVLLDDLSDRRFAADLVFYPPVPQVIRADWSKFSGERFVGWEWIILRSQFATPLRRETDKKNTLLIAMGGSDPAGMTLQAVRATELVEADFPSVIVVGAGFQHMNALKDLLSKTRRQFTLRENVSDMRSEMARSELALCAYGMTAFELAASGVPAIYLCLTEDHAESASALQEAGVGCSLGVFSTVAEEQIANAVSQLLSDRQRRSRMSAAAHKLIDGQGASRIAEVLARRAAE